MNLLDELIAKGLCEPSQLNHLGVLAERLSAIDKLRKLARQELLDETQLLPHLAQRYDIPLLSQQTESPQKIDNELLTRRIYEETQILLVRLGEHKAGLLSVHSDWFSRDRIAFHTQSPLQWFLTTQQQVQAYLQLFLQTEWQTAEVSTADQVQRILEEAITQRCSDIHLEPGAKGLKVRMRIDGHLQDIMEFTLESQVPLLSRLKILAGMDIAVKRRPQDGHYGYHSRQGHSYDLRVSSLPTETGEKLVLRLLDQTPVQYKLGALGFLDDDLDVLTRACQMSSGIILVVGPTGCGKTTTLYAMLNEMNSREKNILTIEDPVEYHIEGINQVTVQPAQELTFASALRASLRQDPDVILIGEIRDEETAEIAIKAALTGHLVLSTLHSVDAVTTIQRLTNLEVEPDLLADTLAVIISQRLVRRSCHHAESETHCSRCHGSGYSGRVPVYEILRIDPLVRQRIREGCTGQDLIAPASDLYFHSFQQTSRRLIQAGITDEKELQTIF